MRKKIEFFALGDEEVREKISDCLGHMLGTERKSNQNQPTAAADSPQITQNHRLFTENKNYW